MLANEEDGCCPWGLTGLDKSLVKVLLDITLAGLQFFERKFIHRTVFEILWLGALRQLDLVVYRWTERRQGIRLDLTEDVLKFVVFGRNYCQDLSPQLLLVVFETGFLVLLILNEAIDLIQARHSEARYNSGSAEIMAMSGGRSLYHEKPQEPRASRYGPFASRSGNTGSGFLFLSLFFGGGGFGSNGTSLLLDTCLCIS